MEEDYKIEEQKAGGQGSKMLGREGVAGIDRVCNLGAVKGDRGRARNFGVLRLVPVCESVGREKEKEKTEGKEG